MKRLLLPILLLAAAITGCTTTRNADGTTTKKVDPVKAAQVRDALEPVAAGAIRRILANSPEHADEIALYLRGVGAVFCRIQETGQFAPDFVLSSLDAVVAPMLGKESYLIDVKNALLALYRIQFEQRFTAELPPDQWPGMVASLICQSIDQGLKDAKKPGVKAELPMGYAHSSMPEGWPVFLLTW